MHKVLQKKSKQSPYKGSSKNSVENVSLFSTIYLPIVDIPRHFANYLSFVNVD